MHSALNDLLAQTGSAESMAIWRLPGSKTVRHICGRAEPFHTDHLRQSGFLIHPFDTQEERAWWIPSGQPASLTGSFQWHYRTPAIAETDKQAYKELVHLAVKAMREGHFSKVVGARAVFRETSRTVTEIFSKLLEAYPSAFCYLFSSPYTGTWLGASPEIFLHWDQERYKTVALAGTQARGNENWTGKEEEEQQLVLEYILELFQELNLTPEVSRRDKIHSGNLVHLINEISGYDKNPGYYLPELIRRLHPTPAVGGLPKEEALAFLIREEKLARSYYSGFLGPVEQEQGRLYVNLRCLEHVQQGVVQYAGAGLTALSDPEMEWQETENKLEVAGKAL